MTNIPTVIVEHLYELSGDDLDRFRWFLKQGVAQGYASIPAAKLENTKREDVVDVMIRVYAAEDAGKVAVQVLRRMQNNNLAEQLEKNLAQVQAQTNQVDSTVSSSAQAPGAPGAPGATGVHQTITADNSGNVSAPVISGATINGPFTITYTH